MARISGVNIPTNKRVHIALTYIYGIGAKTATDICTKASIDISKRVSELNDDELNKIDRFIRKNTIAKYGPVREVRKSLVIELAFDSAQLSSRHKSGIALRFTRVSRVRWDKPVNDVQNIEEIKKELSIYLS